MSLPLLSPPSKVASESDVVSDALLKVESPSDFLDNETSASVLCPAAVVSSVFLDWSSGWSMGMSHADSFSVYLKEKFKNLYLIIPI